MLRSLLLRLTTSESLLRRLATKEVLSSEWVDHGPGSS